MTRRFPLLLVACLLLSGSADAAWLFSKKKHQKPVKARYGVTQEQHQTQTEKLRKKAANNRRRQAARNSR